MIIDVLRPEKDYVPPTQQKASSLTISAVFSDIEIGTPMWFNTAHEAIEHNEKVTDEAKLIMGEQLRQKKKEIGHGKWEQWVSDNLKFTIKTAQRYMYPEDKNDTVSFLPTPPEPPSDKGSEDSVESEDAHVTSNTNDVPICEVHTNTPEDTAEKAEKRANKRTATNQQKRVSIQLPLDVHEDLNSTASEYNITLIKFLEQIVLDYHNIHY